MIRISEGTAASLNLSNTIPETPPTAAYFLIGENCLMNCSFCSQARDMPIREKERLGRVFWPLYRWEDIELPLRKAGQSKFKRVCLQAVRGEKGLKPVFSALSQIKTLTSLPVSISARTVNSEEVSLLFAAGADRVSISLDAAEEKTHYRVKGDSLKKRLDFLLECSRTWPGRLSSHLIRGLGESEEDLLEAATKLTKNNITVALFAFTPLRGTPLAGHPAPSLDSYRRVQAGVYLLKYEPSLFNSFQFAKGKLISFGISPGKLWDYLHDGEAFRTSGCEGCNRPYYNERPGGVMYNFPRPLSPNEKRQAVDCLLESVELM